MSKPGSFQELMNYATTWENDYRLVQQNRLKKAKTEVKRFQPNRTNPNLSFRPRVRTGGVLAIRRPFNPKNRIICNNCGIPGQMCKDCTKPRVVCFGCGQDGHIKPDCPNKPADGGFNKGGAKPRGNGGFPVRGGGNGKNNNGKRGRPFGKLNCTSLEEADNSETAVLGMLSLLTHYGKFCLILVPPHHF